VTDGFRIDFERWVPKAAKSELRQLASLPDADRRLLERLASYEVMRDEVWKKLPAAAQGAEHRIIALTCATAEIVKAWQKIESVRKHGSLHTAKKVARLASKLLDAMKQTSGDARGDLWQFLWPGDRQITFEVALLMVEQLATFYSAADDWYIGVAEESDKLSTLRKRNAKTARQIVFARWLAGCFQSEFGKPLDPIVAALSSVVFGERGEGALAPTIRGRRRSKARR
jgi:hypothetical protein